MCYNFSVFPSTRYRRLRRQPAIRQLVRETQLSPAQLIMPFFVIPGRGIQTPIASMPGHFRYSIDQLLVEAGRLEPLGIKSVLLFGIPSKKDSIGSDALSANGIVAKAVRSLKEKFPKLVVMTDLCFCEYTQHGHCGVLRKNKKGLEEVDNDATLKLIRRAAVVQAQSGADFIAPSGMMDGAVAAIRSELDKRGYTRTGILAYSAKYASVFYGPFREAAQSRPQSGDRRGYQMDSANSEEAVREVIADIQEGADMVMVKPALSYLDVISKIRSQIKIPLVAYNVSGEFAMVKAAEKAGWLDSGGKVAMEILTSIKRAGADLIITYHALEVAKLLKFKAE